MPTFQTQSQIGAYELIRLLGEGGMGEVWLAHDKKADRPVALKFIKPHLLADPGFRKRFTNEARTLGKLEHDRIVSLYAVLDEGEYLALVLRFIDGRSLADKIDAQGAALPWSFVLSCARDILPALQFAHENRIIHRDIKPENILVDGRDRCFLMDFGIAVAAFAERGTQTGFAIGTPHYMSPEQIRTPQLLTPELNGHRSDVYSFGVVLYEMLSGKVPFGANSGLEEIWAIQNAHCNDTALPLSQMNSQVSTAVEEVVMACLEKDPANRPQTCEELLGRLEDAAQGSPAQPPRVYSKTVLEARPGPPLPNQEPLSAPPAVRPQRKVPQGVWYSLAAVTVAGGITFTVWNPGEKKIAGAKPPIVDSATKPERNGTGASTRPQIPNPTKNTKTTATKIAADLTPTKPPVLPPPVPIQQPPPGPTPQQAEAKHKYEEAERSFQDDACNSVPLVKEAIALDPQPRYSQFLVTAKHKCEAP